MAQQAHGGRGYRVHCGNTLSPSPEPVPLVDGPPVAVHQTRSTPELRVALQGVQSGAPVVLSHALGLDHRMWDGVAAELGCAHPVLRYDHRGHGGSAIPAAPVTLDDLVDDAARLIREWGRGPVVFVGISMGGMVGQGLAIRHPDLVRALVLANTTSLYPAAAREGMAQRIAAVEQGGMAAIADAVIERFLHAGFRAAEPTVVQLVRAQLLRCDPAGYAACCHAVVAVNWLPRLHEIRCPTLVLAGARDVGAPPAMAQAIAERIPGARLQVFEDASHLSLYEVPAAFRSALAAFIPA